MTEVRRQLDRIEANITAALEAVATKGVPVPVGANSDDLSRLIAAIGTPLFPLTNTSRTFAEGATITVSNGNHVSVVSPSGIADGAYSFGIRDLSFNADSLADYVTNHWRVPSVYFEVKSGDVIKVVLDSVNLNKCRIDMSNWDVWESLFILDQEVSSHVETEYTMEQDMTVSNLTFFTHGNEYTNNYNFEFDLKLYVNGVRYV